MSFCPCILTIRIQKNGQKLIVKEPLGDYFLDYDISKSKKISMNTKYLNNVITKENLVDIYQILFQRQREHSFFLNV